MHLEGPTGQGPLAAVIISCVSSKGCEARNFRG